MLVLYARYTEGEILRTTLPFYFLNSDLPTKNYDVINSFLGFNRRLICFLFLFRELIGKGESW